MRFFELYLDVQCIGLPLCSTVEYVENINFYISKRKWLVCAKSLAGLTITTRLLWHYYPYLYNIEPRV